MALRVSYKDRIGYYTKTEKYPDEPVQKFRNWICHANCLWADMYFYKAAEDYVRYGVKVKKGQKLNQLIAFWVDTDHLRRGLKGGAYDGCDDFHFYADQLDSTIWAGIKALVAAGKKVTIEPKKKK